jgi:protein SCO1
LDVKSRSFILLILLFAGTIRAQATQPSLLSRIGIDQKLGAQVPADLTFTDENGKTVHLGDYLGKRPVILSLVYYQCPMLCTMSLNDLTRAMGAMPLNPGEDFEIVTVSFDPREGPDLALAKKKRYVHEYKKPMAGEAWHFLSGDETNIQKLTEAVGFRYAWDDKYNQYAHAAGFVVLTPSGTVSRYFYGVDYSSKDMRLALTEASEGKVSHPVEQFLLYCYHYDPSTGKYSLAILRLLKVMAAITALSLGAFLFVNFRRDLRVSRRASEPR